MFCIFAEIEAVEACRWLKETGFPQYAQMYEGKKRMIGEAFSSGIEPRHEKSCLRGN